MNAKDIGRCIREIRKGACATQKEMAKLLGLKSGAAISAYETGDAYPTIDTLLKLAEIGNTSYDWILTGGYMAEDPDGKIIQITSAEMQLLKNLRQAPPEVRKLVAQLIQAMTIELGSKNSAS
ncbi:MAG: HTH-type transcriptional regulator Xre [Syntrophus sp. PtaB.Bin138]|nr:helix-turn-helix transcriptional regulator [Geobacteraceae bacterium]OPY14658.1 MAG: HTH-type transcriptional regulator Xre [Syntrophus sp. PtaB.Bin138]